MSCNVTARATAQSAECETWLQRGIWIARSAPALDCHSQGAHHRRRRMLKGVLHEDAARLDVRPIEVVTARAWIDAIGDCAVCVGGTIRPGRVEFTIEARHTPRQWIVVYGALSHPMRPNPRPRPRGPKGFPCWLERSSLPHRLEKQKSAQEPATDQHPRGDRARSGCKESTWCAGHNQLSVGAHGNELARCRVHRVSGNVARIAVLVALMMLAVAVARQS